MAGNNKYKFFGNEPNNPYYQAMKNAGMFDYYPNYNNSRNSYAMSQMTPVNRNSRYDFAMMQMPFNYSRKLNDFDEENEWANNYQIARNNNPYDYSVNMRATTPVYGVKTKSLKNPKESDNGQKSSLLRRVFNNRDKDTNSEQGDLFYNISMALDKAKSTLKNAPLYDSIFGYYQKKQNTPDYSGIENAKNYAMRQTPVTRANPMHIMGRLKNNIYDYLPVANQISSQTATAQNLASRQGSGNMNMLMSHISNLLSNTSQRIGKAALEAWKANEANRMAVAQENRRADEANATAENNAEQNYINTLNAQRAADKQLGYNALSNYAQQKYNMQQQYNRELDKKRDEIVTNLGRFGQNAFDAVTANSNMANDYWRDDFGQLHHKQGATGHRWNGEDLSTANNYKDMYDSIYNSLDDNAKAEFDKMSDIEKKNYILNLIKNNNNGQIVVG